jgi:hypothetical protein
VSGLETGFKSEMRTARGECGALHVTPRGLLWSAGRRSAKADGYDRRERCETRLFGDLETCQSYST